jgi:hypothetical protein
MASGYAPWAQEESVRSRRLSGASVRPLNFTIRTPWGHYSHRSGVCHLASVAGITFLVSGLRGRITPEAALGALAFWFGAVCAASVGGLAAALSIGPSAMLQPRAQVIGYLGCLTPVAGAGGSRFDNGRSTAF